MPSARAARLFQRIALPPCLLAVLTPVLFSCTRPAPPPRPAGPSIILISLDSLRADHLGTYGYERKSGRKTSPALDAFAAQSVVFEQAYANACNTLPSHTTMFTGAYPLRHGVHSPVGSDRDPKDRARALPATIATLPELLRAKGYRTARFAHSRDYFLDASLGLGRGFDELHPYGLETSESASEIARWAETRTSPYFLFVHSKRPHAPYVLPAPYDTQFDPSYKGPIIGNEAKFAAYLEGKGLKKDQVSIPGLLPEQNEFIRLANLKNPSDARHLEALYDGAIALTDRLLGELLGRLEKSGALREAIVVVTSDHGEEFGEHGDFYHRKPTREVLNVPLILRAPGLAPARIGALAQTADIVPTLLELAGLEPLKGIDGKSLLPAIRSPGTEIHEAVFAQHLFPHEIGRQAVRTKRWALFSSADGEVALYDSSSDPGEKQDLSAKRPEIVDELSGKLKLLELDSVSRSN